MDYHRIFLEIIKDFKENYSYLAFKKHTVENLIETYGNLFRNISDENNFMINLSKVLKLFEDPHIWLIDSKGNMFRTENKKVIANFDHRITYSRYFHGEFKFQNKIGAIGIYNDILYVNINTWDNNARKQIEDLLHFFEFAIINYKFIKKLIIDVRANGGGNDEFAERFLSYLIPEGKKGDVCKYLKRLNKDDPKKIGLDWIRSVKSHKNLHFQGQIAALIGEVCMSSNEFFVMGLEALKRYTKIGKVSKVTLIGYKTFGSSGNPQLFKHTSGISYMIPSWIAYTSRGKLLEGNGVKPDIVIDPSKTMTESRDKAFDKAVKVLD